MQLTSKSSNGSDQLHHDGLHRFHSGLDEDGVIADLVRNFVKQDGQGGDLAHALASQEGRSDCQAVGKVVEGVGEQVEVAGDFDLADLVAAASVVVVLALESLHRYKLKDASNCPRI